MEKIFDFLKELLKFINNIFITPRRQIQKVVKIYDIMHKTLNYTDVQRFTVFKVHNGGGLIKPNGELYLSVIYEDYTVPMESSKADYQRYTLDKEMMKVLLDVTDAKKKCFVTDKLEDGTLKRTYFKWGVKSSVMYFLCQDKKSMYFCSFSTANSGDLLCGQQSVTLDLAANAIKQNIR